MQKLSAFLIVCNEREQLPRCLASLQDVVDEIVVVDTGSGDGTPAYLAEAASAHTGPRLRWWTESFRGFGPSRRRALAGVTGDWALWVDADETVGPALSDRLSVLRRGGLEAHDVWEIRLENRVLGRTMRCRSLARQYRKRLFRVGRATVGNAPVHEDLVPAPGASVGRLEEPLIHDTWASWHRYRRKIDLYTSLEAALTPGRYGPWLPLHLLATGPASWYREYLWRGAWRDGRAGWAWSLAVAWSGILRDLKRLGWVRKSVPIARIGHVGDPADR
jgi:glycosyltransferase involved in cell wall biosynthesis